ncbi:NAD(P)/FAD-dependent oxidoreductase [Rhodoblastus acidophilus]|uniref:NAD(P)/FAD-dependent oxidoreductase n=1 Tax=Candidatus Rhodoblastus alkanivorans TaxID=2954117 RepID=A0ABS9Z666_9HYPH|nr:NAD(P)/FAD-dependent oxidoreductase [Candidatus Rhodoblastus alkanivorans]MCI4679127.1 NAD(P)/FAD-dependent oxidoreductase [Candidatus Rhodoblastus alkanivorans]MCI4683123.1 NAD(P)/FAD-dependent oxidoreductase [Candidatus Rhodoblastus alkanivorans]MDI4640434.1 NAD(P)/FAD-dependent oxidoreductase [Rhodoblastus acidophilus]
MDFDAVVIGAGVVGLAVARQFADAGREALVLEAEKTIGVHTSSRNSEVIHAGLYYPENSLKARLCVEGRKMLYAFCAERGVPAQRLGKLIVATDERQIPKLEALHRRGIANGVDDLVPLSREEARRLEPEVECVAALLSPSTGIVDSHALMLALQGDAEAKGAQFVFQTRVTGIAPQGDGYQVRTAGGDTVSCAAVVNCAGHGAHEIARRIETYPADLIPPRFMAKGNYFTVSGRTPFSHLIYPMPVEGGLGVHVTLDLGGRMRLGPDVQWVDELDYTPMSGQEEEFREAVMRYWPGIEKREIASAYCGIRPKITGPGADNADFRIDGPELHGMANLVNFFGIESPGLTSSLALAEHAANRLFER